MVLALAEIGGDGMTLASTSTKMRAGMRAMAVLIVPFTLKISTGVFVYWTTSNLFSILQTLALKVGGGGGQGGGWGGGGGGERGGEE